MIDLAFVERLLDLLNRSRAGSIEVRRSFWLGTTIRVSKDATLPPTGPVTYQVSGTPAPGPAAGPAAPAPSDAAPAPQVPAVQALEIKSPMVGTFYARPEPGAEPYIRLGARVKVGETLCIIEAMKIMNPLVSEVAGVVKEILVEDAQPVEFGQVLFRVDPHG